MPTVCSTRMECDGVCAVVEGSLANVNAYIGNAGPVVRQPSRFVETDDRFVTNRADIVKVTTYEPVGGSEPLGMPTTNWLNELTQTGVSGTILDSNEPAAKPSQPKPNFFGAAGPLGNGPLGLPDMGLCPAQGVVRNGGTASVPGHQQNTRRAKTRGGKGLGLPKLEFATPHVQPPAPAIQQNTKRPSGKKPLGLPKLDF